MLLAGHCARHKKEEASKLVLWNPSTRQERANCGKSKTKFVDTLLRTLVSTMKTKLELLCLIVKAGKEPIQRVRPDVTITIFKGGSK